MLTFGLFVLILPGDRVPSGYTPVLPPYGEVEETAYRFEAADVRRKVDKSFVLAVLVHARKVKVEFEPPRFYPLVGPAYLNRTRWNCVLIQVSSCAGRSGQQVSLVIKNVAVEKQFLHLCRPVPPCGQLARILGRP